MSTSNGWDKSVIARIAQELKDQPGALLLILRRIQDEVGWVPEESVPILADALNLSRAEVHGVVSFYHDFREAPAGRHVLKLCRAEACQSMGADALAEQARQRLNVDWHETTRDEQVTLEPVFCLGLCACAPAAMLDGQVFGALDEARLSSLIDRARR